MRLELFYPVKPFRVNQHFGANEPCVKDFGLPTQRVVTPPGPTFTCPTGYEKLYSQWGMSGHNGTDLMAGEQKVYAAHGGVVVEKQTVPSRGLGLGILTNEPVELDEHGVHYIKIRYWHLKSFNVEVGDSVKAGQLIGVSDSTGYSSGNHLHFEGQPMNKDAGGHPYIALSDSGSSVIANAIDVEPFLNGKYAEDIQKILRGSDQIAVFAAQKQSTGDTKSANILYALAAMLRTFGL